MTEAPPELPIENTPELTRSIVYSLLSQGNTMAHVAQHFNMKYHELCTFLEDQGLAFPVTKLEVLSDCRDTRFGANTSILYKGVTPTWTSCLVADDKVEPCFWCGGEATVRLKLLRTEGGLFAADSAILTSDFAWCCETCRPCLGHFVTITHTFTVASTQVLLNFKTQGRMRGHDYTLRISVRLPVHRSVGIALDPATFRTMVENNVCSVLQGNLSNVFSRSLNPTCENLVWWIWRQLVSTSNLKGIQSIHLGCSEYDCVLERRDVVDYVLNNNVRGESNEKATD
jgi:6-pyruvoyl-tetrahydropterin synthase